MILPPMWQGIPLESVLVRRGGKDRKVFWHKNMKVFVSHKFRNVNKPALRKKIEYLTSLLESEGHSTFNYFGDVEKWQPKEWAPGEVLRQAFKHIEECDALLVLYDNPEASEGMLLEIGYALALQKKVNILKSKKVNNPSLLALADTVIEFDVLEEVKRIFGGIV